MAGQVVFPRPGGVVGGKYVLEAMLDSSAAGAVFRARHVNTGRPFAIRWLTRPTGSRASVQPASQAPAQIAENPLVLAPLDVGRTPHGAYVVMEWLNGETLASRLVCVGAMQPTAAATILVPCLRAIHEMHREFAVHGDLRPGNIFVCRGVERRAESVRVFDYSIAGVSWLPERIDADGGYSRDAQFLAPEQLTNSPVDHRADVYAFGVMLYACVTGQLPFTPERSDDFARWVYGQDPPALPGAPGLTPSLYRLLARTMARDASERCDSCGEFADALEQVAHESGVSRVSVQPTRVIRSSRPTMRLASELPLAPPTMRLASELPLAPPRALGPNSLRATVSREPVASPPPPPPTLRIESTLPLEVLRPQSHRKPISRGGLLLSASLVVFGVVPTVAYFTPPDEREALEHIHASPSVLEHAAAAVQPPAIVVPIAEPVVGDNSNMLIVNVPERAPIGPSLLVDDPSTLIDESDPLIAAALAAEDEDSRQPAAPANESNPTGQSE